MRNILGGRVGHPVLNIMKKTRFAHRGWHDKPRIPENSLAAFSRALQRGWGAELDVHLLKDGTLCVFHDSDLFRCTGQQGVIEDLDRAGLKQLRLEGTEEQVPLFDEVLKLFEKRAPLIIELKTHNKNHKALVAAVMKRLDQYTGVYCIESFDPRALLCLKQLRPDVCRGQLSMDFVSTPEGQPKLLRRPLKNMWFNLFTRPDFIAYRFSDRQCPALRRAIDRRGVQEVSWTIASKQDLLSAEKAGCIPIFERFDPDK